MRPHASLFAGLLACAVLAGATHAQSDYPGRPIRYIVASANFAISASQNLPNSAAPMKRTVRPAFS